MSKRAFFMSFYTKYTQSIFSSKIVRIRYFATLQYCKLREGVAKLQSNKSPISQIYLYTSAICRLPNSVECGKWQNKATLIYCTIFNKNCMSFFVASKIPAKILRE